MKTPKTKKPTQDKKNLTQVGGVWYFRRATADDRGRVVREQFSLHTRDLHEARAKRDAHLKAQSRAAADAALGLTPPKAAKFATLDEVIFAYRASRCKGEVREATRKMNGQCLLNLARRAFGLADTKAAGAITVDRIDKPALLRYQESFFGAAERADPMAAARATVNANSILLKARSVFAHPEVFELAGLHAPMPEAFRQVKQLADPNFKQRIAFRPFNQEEGRALLGALAKLRETHPRLHLMATLMFRCGLRNSEAAALHHEWIVREGDGFAVEVAYRPYFEPKTPASCRRVALPADVLEDMRRATGFAFTPEEREAWRIMPTLAPREREKRLNGGRITTPGMSDEARRRWSVTTLNAWLSAVLPERSAYDLRKQAGSMMAHAYADIREAQKFLGHSGVTTTETYYAKSLTTLKLAPIAFAEA